MTTTAAPSPTSVTRLQRNLLGRDFCVGDIHGMFGMLEDLLEEADFDTRRDRLISVGDLVDRGPESMRAVEFLARPWFYAIRGNHEDMLINCFEDPSDQSTEKMWHQNGGAWWQQTSEADRQKIYEAVRPLPLVMEVQTSFGTVGAVHADIPPGMGWAQFLQELQAGVENTVQTALWSRTRAKMYKIAGAVDGILRVYCGHNIVNEPRKAGNVRYIDTGAYLYDGGRLTMLEISNADEPAYSVSQVI